MSASGGGKPAQTGLVDMGQNHFYDNPADYPPPFLASRPCELHRLVQRDGAERHLAADCSRPRAARSMTSAIDSADHGRSSTTMHHAPAPNLGIKLRVWGGFTGARLGQEHRRAAASPITGQDVGRSAVYAPQTIGRFWTADYIDAWTSLQNALANRYDSNPVIRGISQTAGAAATDEPFVPLETTAGAATDRRADGEPGRRRLQAGGYTDAAEMLTLRAAIADYAQWSTTPLDYTMNRFHLFDSTDYLGN